MRFYQFIAFPTTCYVLEVAFWIAFGRVPEPMYDDEDEARDGRHAQETGEVREFHHCYSVEEFNLIGSSVDSDRYLQAVDSTYGRSGKEIREYLDKFISMLTMDDRSDVDREFAESKMREIRATEERAMEDADWLHEVEAPLIPHVDTMKAVVFQALAQKRLKATGWLEFTAEEMVENNKNYTDAYPPGPPEGRFVDVPSTAWTLSGFDWENSTLTSGKAVYRAVQCKWDDVGSLFPTPQCEFSTRTFKMFPGVVVLDEEGASRAAEAASSRRRGRPPKGSGGIDIKKAVQNYFRPKLNRMDPGIKREALISEVMEFVKLVFQESVSRSTAQSYIAPLMANQKSSMQDAASGN